jgi:glycosyltransferase involved in cell wall biosynthesis
VRVVFLTHNYPRDPGDLAGAFLATLARALVARGVEVRVVAPSDRGRGGDGTEQGIVVRRVRYASPERETLAYGGLTRSLARGPAGLTGLVALRRALRRAAAEEMADGADLIHAHWWIPAGLAVPRGAPFVLTSHGSDAALLPRSRAARFLARPVYARARVVTAVSRELAGWIGTSMHRHVGPDHVHPMPVDAADFPWSTGGGGLVVVARLTRQKRVHLAVEAVACLAAIGVELRLTVVGDGPERAALERLAEERGVAHLVRFAGRVAPHEVPSFLAAADLMLFPAQGEGLGLVAAEALMAGVPVVACWDGGGVLDVVPEQGAGRRALPSGEALADAALDLLHAPDRAAAVRADGERLRIELSPARVAEVCEGWYHEALSTRSFA